MIISSSNEYDTLKTCVVGDATDARFPVLDEIFNYNDEISEWKDCPIPKGDFPKHIIDETNEDLEALISVLRSFDVEVYRPNELDHSHIVKTYEWESDGMYRYCPRDVLLVIDDLVIETPMTYRSRQFEVSAYWKIKVKAIRDNARWISAPKPRLLTQDTYIQEDNIILSEKEPMFDAANILRHNKDIIYLVSNTGNKSGAKWLQNILGTSYKVHMLENIYAYAHIDSTISILRDGLVVLNASRIDPNNCPDIFKNWDKIYVEDVVAQSFYKYPYSSKWIALNMFSINPNTVIVDKNQVDLIKQIEKFNITVIPLELRHSRTLGGGFHCVTLDLFRQQ
jgi:N-dimethylarginine dimethylaminohydrolase